MSLKDSKTEQNLKDAFAGESRQTVVICILRRKQTSKAITMSRPYSVQLPKVRRDMRTGISNTWKKQATRRPACQSDRPPPISPLQ